MSEFAVGRANSGNGCVSPRPRGTFPALTRDHGESARAATVCSAPGWRENARPVSAGGFARPTTSLDRGLDKSRDPHVIMGRSRAKTAITGRGRATSRPPVTRRAKNPARPRGAAGRNGGIA